MDNHTQHPLVSIIVPVYNTAPYLKRCVTSLSRQTYANIEIVLVDDGSTDSSTSLCDSIAQADSRIRVIHQTNQGQAVARNEGLAHSSGNYVMLVDSDDYLLPTACEELVRVATSTGADLISFREIVYHESQQQTLKPSGSGDTITMSAYEAGEHYLCGRYFQHAPWSKFYSRHILEEVPFPPGLLAEDYAVSYLHLDACNMITFYDRVLYGYNIREGSTMTSGSLKLIRDVYRTSCVKRNFDLKKYPQHRKRIEGAYANCLLKTFARFYNEHLPLTDPDRKEVTRRLSKLSFKALPLGSQLALLLYKINKPLFARFMKLIKHNG